MEKFHGGCIGCTMQDKNGLGYCVGCQYFEADWTLPNLNDSQKEAKVKLDAIRDIAKTLAKIQNKCK